MTTKVSKSYQWNGICDVCGFKKKSYEMAKRWDGYMVCRDTCWEQRHVADFYRTKNDVHKLPWTKPEPADTYITAGNTGGDGLHVMDGFVIDGSSIG